MHTINLIMYTRNMPIFYVNIEFISVVLLNFNTKNKMHDNIIYVDVENIKFKEYLTFVACDLIYYAYELLK